MIINIDIDEPDLTQYCSLMDPAQKQEFILNKLVGIFDEHCLEIMRRDRSRRIDDALRERKEHNAARGIDGKSMVDVRRSIVDQGYTSEQAIMIEEYIRNKTKFDYTALLEALKGGSPIHALMDLPSKENLIAIAKRLRKESTAPVRPSDAGRARGRGGGKKAKTRRGSKRTRR